MRAALETPTRKRKLGDKDSNLDKQNQNLLCYRYTIAQSIACLRSGGVTPDNDSLHALGTQRVSKRPADGPFAVPSPAKDRKVRKPRQQVPETLVSGRELDFPSAAIEKPQTAPRPCSKPPGEPGFPAGVRRGRFQSGEKSRKGKPASSTRQSAGSCSLGLCQEAFSAFIRQ